MIAIGSDHAGVALKKALTAHLEERGLPFHDYGTFDEQSCDYPLIAREVCAAVTEGTAQKGILICGTGIGISIAANKLGGIRCALCAEPVSAALSRAHNDANCLALGARVVGDALAAGIVDAFLDTDFDTGNPRHARRVRQISALEERAL